MKNKRNVILLGLVSFINDTASKIILPILPLFIKEIGGAGLAVGIISGLGESVSSLFKMLAGYYSDKMGKRKPFIFFGYLISSISKFLLAFSTLWPQVLVLRVGERLGKGLRSAPRDAVLASSMEKKKRGKGFGIHRAMDSGGAVLGALLAFIFFWYLNFNFRTIFLIAGIIAFLSLIPLSLIKEREKEEKKGDIRLGFKYLSKELKFFLIIATLFSLGNFSYMFFVLKSESFFTGRLAVGIPIILYILYNTSYTLFAIPAGILSDRIGKKYVLLMGYSLFGLVSLGFIFSKSLSFFILLFILFGLNYALVNATQRALVSDLAKEEARGTALGTFQMFTALANLPAGIIAGLIWDINTAYPFIYGALISLLTILLFFIFNLYSEKE